MIDFECPNCGQELSADQSDRGQVFPCPQCGESVQVPNAFKLPEKKKSVTIRSSSQRQCPFCGELIQKTATKCRYCGEWITGKNRAPRSFSDEYGFKTTAPKRVEKPGCVTFAVFLMVVQLVLGWIVSIADPSFRASLAAMGTDPTFANVVGGVTTFILGLIILGINTGHGWCRMLFLVLTGISFPFWVIGFIMCISNGVSIPIWQIISFVFPVVEFFLLASSSAGNWYRAIANGQKR
jgi:DNA-directed RNA polymerase subunit RPC12/RpoP